MTATEKTNLVATIVIENTDHKVNTIAMDFKIISSILQECDRVVRVILEERKKRAKL